MPTFCEKWLLFCLETLLGSRRRHHISAGSSRNFHPDEPKVFWIVAPTINTETVSCLLCVKRRKIRALTWPHIEIWLTAFWAVTPPSVYDGWSSERFKSRPKPRLLASGPTSGSVTGKRGQRSLKGTQCHPLTAATVDTQDKVGPAIGP